MTCYSYDVILWRDWRVISSLILITQEMPCKHTNRSYFMCLGVFVNRRSSLLQASDHIDDVLERKKGRAACEFEKACRRCVARLDYQCRATRRHPPLLHAERKPSTSSSVGWSHTMAWRMVNVEKTCTNHHSRSCCAGDGKSMLHGPDILIRHLLYRMPSMLTHTHHNVSMLLDEHVR